METSDIRDLVHFRADGPSRRDLLETDHLWSEVLCLQENQRLGPIGDGSSDALFVVLAGEISVQVDKRRARMKQWEAVSVPAGAELTLANASPEPGVILVVVGPPPVADRAADRGSG